LLSQELSSQTDSQIKKDLNRTVTDEKLFSVDTTKSTLYNVLRAYANCDKEVSYCQGMNFIVAFLLIVSDFNEVDTLYMMMFLFMFNKTNLGIRGFFMNNFPLLNLYTYQFDFLFDKHFPSLKKHFEYLEIPKELWISKWIQTLFTICLPLDVLIRLWDCIFAKGLEFIFNFSLALIKVLEPDLKKFQDISDISEYFKSLNPYCNNTSGKNFKLDVESLIKDALNTKVSKNLLNNLKIEYEQKFNVDLSFLNVNYDLRSLYNSTNSNKDNIEIFENENYMQSKPFLNPIKIDLKSKFKIKSEDIIQEEDARRKSIDLKAYQTNTNLDIVADENDNNENCSEFDLCDEDVMNNVKSHTLNTKSLEEESKKRVLEKKITNINDI
jgi:aarF domain-containing kinase